MLQFDVTETIEGLLFAVGDEAERIPASKFGGGGTDFGVEGSREGGGGLAGLSGGEGGSAGDEGGDDSGLHGCDVGKFGKGDNSAVKKAQESSTQVEVHVMGRIFSEGQTFIYDIFRYL